MNRHERATVAALVVALGAATGCAGKSTRSGSAGATSGAESGAPSNAGTGGNDAAGGEAGAAAGAGGTAASAGCGSSVAIDETEAAARARAFVFAQAPGFNPDSSFSAVDLPIAGLWDALELQLFNVSSRLGDQPPHTHWVFVRFGESFYELEFGLPHHGLDSAVVADGAVYYSVQMGSGSIRSRIGRLRVRDCAVERIESAEYFERARASTLFVKLSEGVVVVEKGALVNCRDCSRETFAFNEWSEATWFATLAPREDHIDLLDAAGNVIPQQ